MSDYTPILETMKDHSRLAGTVTERLTRRRRLRCEYMPDRSYGREHAPLTGLESYDYWWSLWTPAASRDDRQRGHVEPAARGWRCVLRESDVLRLLQGLDVEAPAEDDATLFATIARRSRG